MLRIVARFRLNIHDTVCVPLQTLCFSVLGLRFIHMGKGALNSFIFMAM